MSAVQICSVKVLVLPPALAALLWKLLLSLLAGPDTLQLALCPLQLMACGGEERLFANICRLAFFAH